MKIKMKHLLAAVAIGAVILFAVGNYVQEKANEFVSGIDQIGQEYMNGSFDNIPDELK